jgi:hypothetical protein
MVAASVARGSGEREGPRVVRSNFGLTDVPGVPTNAGDLR